MTYRSGKLDSFKTWNGNKYNEDVNPFEFLKDYNIVYENPTQARVILSTLKSLNFKLYHRDEPSDQKLGEWDAIVKAESADFSLGGRRFRNNPQINFDEFLKLTKNRNVKKIEKPDIDPFGEEDWGYETYESSGNNTPPIFEMGDTVEVNGEVGSRHFKGETGEITKINPNGGLNRVDKLNGMGHGKNDKFYYGVVYYISGDVKYWVSPWNMTKIDDNQNDNQNRIRWYKNGKLE